MSKRDIIFEYEWRVYFPSKHEKIVTEALVGRSFDVERSIDFRKFHYITKPKNARLTQAESSYLTGMLTQLLLLPLAEWPSDSDE